MSVGGASRPCTFEAVHPMTDEQVDDSSVERDGSVVRFQVDSREAKGKGQIWVVRDV